MKKKVFLLINDEELPVCTLVPIPQQHCVN